MVATSGKWGRLARSLVAYVDEADRLAPNRSTASDGSIGDTAHAARASDHNPAHGIVHAVDLTHDPAGGWDAHGRLEELRVRRDPRVKYGISRRRSFDSTGADAWQWKPYRGINPHDHHAHLSILDTPAAENDTSPWFPPITTPTKPPQQEDDDMDLDWLLSDAADKDGTVWLWRPRQPKVKIIDRVELQALVDLDAEARTSGDKMLFHPTGALDPRYPNLHVRTVPTAFLDGLPVGKA